MLSKKGFLIVQNNENKHLFVIFLGSYTLLIGMTTQIELAIDQIFTTNFIRGIYHYR